MRSALLPDSAVAVEIGAAWPSVAGVAGEGAAAGGPAGVGLPGGTGSGGAAGRPVA